MSANTQNMTPPANPPNEPPTRLRMELEISSDSMLASLRLHYHRHLAFHYEDVLELLDSKKIVYGIRHEEIRRLESEYRDVDLKEDENEPTFELVVAKGYPMVPPQDGKVEIFVKSPPPVVIDETGRADFRNIQRFPAVDKGDLLARLFPSVPGQAGFNIYGQEVQPPAPKADLLETGKNVIALAGEEPWTDYAARVHGIFVHTGHFIDVNPELLIPGNVGLESGNVDYDGNVKVGRNIERGAGVRCLGDLRVGGMIETGDIRVGGSLIVTGGINAGRERLLHVRGDMQAYYIDNSRVFIEGSIEIRRSINASDVICMGDLSIPEKNSNICGGEIYVYGSLSCASIGNRAETPTKIVLGNQIKNIQLLKRRLHEKELLEEKLEIAKEELQKVKIYVKRMRGKIPAERRLQFREKTVQYQYLKSSLENCKANIEGLKKSQYNKEPVRLIVRDWIYPGTVIHYRHYIEKITAPQSKCVIKFAPQYDGPVITAWKPED